MTDEDLKYFTEKAGGYLDVGFGLDYNLFCIEQGIIIANALQNEENIKEWYKLGFDDQKKAVPGLDDGHSGNTFGMAVSMARDYVTRVRVIRAKTLKEILDESE